MRSARNASRQTMLSGRGQKESAKKRFDEVKAEATEVAEATQAFARIKPFLDEAEKARNNAKRKIEKEIASMRWSSLFYRSRVMPLVCALRAIDTYHHYLTSLFARDQQNQARIERLLDEKDKLFNLLTKQ